MKTTELENVCQLFGSDDKTNHQLALQVLKGQPELTEEVKAFFQPILEASKKKTVNSIPSILEQLKKGKGTMKARLQLGTLPFLHPYIENLALNDE